MHTLKKLMIILIAILVFTGCSHTEDMEALNSEGFAYYEDEAYDEAIEIYSSGIDQYPDYMEFYINRAMAYYASGQAELAFNDLDYVIGKKPNSAYAYTNRGSIYLSEGDAGSALKDFYAAIEHKDSFTDQEGLYSTYLNLGTLLHQLAQYDESYQVLLKALEIRDDDPTLYNALGMLKKSTGNLEEALTYYDTAIEMDQYFAYAYANRAIAYYMQGDIDLALFDAKTAMDIDAYIPQMYDLLSKIYVDLEAYDLAEKIAKQGLSLWESYGLLYVDIGNIYIIQEDYGNALMQYSLGVDNGDVSGYLGQAIGYRLIEDYDRAKSALDTYETEAGISVISQMERGRLLYASEAYTQALALFDDLYTTDASNIVAKFYVAKSNEMLGNIDLARQLLKEVIEDEPNYTEAVEALAFIEEHN